MSRLPDNDRALPADIRDCRTAGISTRSLPGPVTPWPPSVTYLNCSATLLSHTSTTIEQHSTEMCLTLCFWYSPPLVPHLTPWHWLDQHTAGGHLTAVLFLTGCPTLNALLTLTRLDNSGSLTRRPWSTYHEVSLHCRCHRNTNGDLSTLVLISQQSGQHEKYCWNLNGIDLLNKCSEAGGRASL